MALACQTARFRVPELTALLFLLYGAVRIFTTGIPAENRAEQSKENVATYGDGLEERSSRPEAEGTSGKHRCWIFRQLVQTPQSRVRVAVQSLVRSSSFACLYRTLFTERMRSGKRKAECLIRLIRLVIRSHGTFSFGSRNFNSNFTNRRRP